MSRLPPQPTAGEQCHPWSMSIVVFGSLNVDTFLDVDHEPAWGETVLASGSMREAGGKGANQAVAARRLGADVLMVGRVGDDADGAFLRAALAADRIEDRLTKGTAPTGSAFILRDEAGRNAIVVNPGANAGADVADLASAADNRRGTLLVLQLEIPLAAVAGAVAIAVRSGWRVLLNAAPAQPLPADLLSEVEVLVVNEHEAGELGGVPVTDVGSARTAAQRLSARGPSMVAVTLGELGAVLVAEGQAWHAPAPRVDVADTTAAGDAFVGALAVALLEAMPAPRALGFAVAAGTLSVQAAAAQPSLPGRPAVDALASRIMVAALRIDPALG